MIQFSQGSLCSLAPSFTWSLPGILACLSVSLLESCCPVLSDKTFQDSMLPTEKVPCVFTWKTDLKPNFISHCFLLQSLTLLVPLLFPNNQATSLHPSFVSAFSSLRNVLSSLPSLIILSFKSQFGYHLSTRHFWTILVPLEFFLLLKTKTKAKKTTTTKNPHRVVIVVLSHAVIRPQFILLLFID